MHRPLAEGGYQPFGDVQLAGERAQVLGDPRGQRHAVAEPSIRLLGFELTGPKHPAVALAVGERVQVPLDVVNLLREPAGVVG